MKASELRAMQAQYMSGNYTPRRTETNERPMVSRASNRQVSYLTDLVARHPDHANTIGITSVTDLRTLTEAAASDSISYIINEGGR